MERILTVCQMRNADRFTIEKLGISHEELVDRAGTAVAEVIKERFLGGRVLVVVGKGNNGKDGLVTANILSKTHGFSVSVLNVEKGITKLLEKKYDIILDCIFGTGLNKIVDGKYKEIIEKINQNDAFVIACDIPSGINGDNGKIMGVAVKANLTVAIQEYKVGHFLGDAIDYCGQIICKDIGISVWEDNVIKRLDDRDAKKIFEQRNRNVNKGFFGKAGIIAGSKCFSGSAFLANLALASLKSGVGYSYFGVPNCLFNAFVGQTPESILIPLCDDGNSIVFDEKDIEKFFSCNSIALGMGMTVSEDVYKTIEFILRNYSGTLIIDADGLNCLAKFGRNILKDKKCKVVLTPHIGEFSRLTGVDKDELQENLISCAVSFAKEYGVILVIKSAVSVITDGVETYLNTTGCSGMAKAGSGDVLSGLMAGLTARADDVMSAVCVSAYVFGRAGEFAQKQENEFTMTATDVIAKFSKVINNL